MFPNMFESLVELFVIFSCTWFFTHGSGQSTAVANNSSYCNDKAAFDACLATMPSAPTGIPSSNESVVKACKAFDSGMECFKNWTECLEKNDRKKATSSIEGAVEFYKFLCHDKKFRKEYLQHSACYVRISDVWHNCTNSFIQSLKRLDHSKDPRNLCCPRYRFLHCIHGAANKFCLKNATEFVKKIAEVLVSSYTGSTTTNSLCGSIGERECGQTSSARSSSKFPSASALFHIILSYPTKGLINSLNVLQNLAFSDITTFFGALSREFSPYFSYNHHHLLNLVKNETKLCSRSQDPHVSDYYSLHNTNSFATAKFPRV